MFTLIYVVLALWLSAGLVQTHVSMKHFTKVAAENLVKYFDFTKLDPDLQKRILGVRTHEGGVVMDFSRETCYWLVASTIYVYGALVGAKWAWKFKFKPNPKWEDLVADLNRYTPTVRF